MIIKDIYFNGYEVLAVRFIEHPKGENTEGGRFDVVWGKVKIGFGEEDNGEKFIHINAKPTLKAYSGEDEKSEEKLAFECEITLRIIFNYKGEHHITEEAFEKNRWFFDNYLALCSKLALENAMKNTAIESISLPWSRSN